MWQVMPASKELTLGQNSCWGNFSLGLSGFLCSWSLLHQERMWEPIRDWSGQRDQVLVSVLELFMHLYWQSLVRNTSNSWISEEIFEQWFTYLRLTTRLQIMFHFKHFLSGPMHCVFLNISLSKLSASLAFIFHYKTKIWQCQCEECK